MFDLFWSKVTMTADKLDLEPPRLPHKRRVPKRFETGSTEREFVDSPKQHFKVAYFEALDLVITSITERFDQPGFKVYRNLQELVTKAAKGEEYDEEYKFVVSFYDGDLNPTRLRSQLEILRTHFTTQASTLLFNDVLSFLQDLSAARKEFFSEVIILVKLILVMPATNASSERAFSALRRLKTYLRNTITQQRLNHALLLHVHKDKTDQLNLVNVGNNFVAGSEHRLSLFGKF